MGLKLAILISLLVLQGVFYVSCKECKSPDDCKPDECCAVGMMRFSIPGCLPKRKRNENCRVGNTPNEKGIFSSVCPCVDGLSCIRGKCK
uniref:U11-Theraphotoxin-Ct1a_1 n=1 Tax=Coremiocnemis tropix TaxID=1904443 RepID=A0A482Z9F7_CORTR